MYSMVLKSSGISQLDIYDTDTNNSVCLSGFFTSYVRILWILWLHQQMMLKMLYVWGISYDSWILFSIVNESSV